jgi:hypothetical protein
MVFNDRQFLTAASIIRLRFLQLYRSSGDLGLFRVLLLAFILIPLIGLFLIQRIAVHPWPLIIPASTLYILWLVHGRRRDWHFLLAILPHPQALFIAEYFLFTLPVTALLLTATLYIHALVFIVFLTLIAFTVPSQGKTASRTIKLPLIPAGIFKWRNGKVIPSGMFEWRSRMLIPAGMFEWRSGMLIPAGIFKWRSGMLIPAGMFEWQSGIRKNLVVLVLFYIPGLFGFFHIGFSALSLLLLTMVFVSFYSEYEPVNMLTAGGNRSWRFLAVKVAGHTGCFALLLLPLLLIAMIHGEYPGFTAGYFLASLNLLAFSILLKYYQYRPGAYSGAHQFLTTLACFISVILPVALLFVVFNSFLAIGANRNLKIYLDDYN